MESFTIRPLYLLGKEPLYPLYKSLGGSQIRSVESRKLLTLPGVNLQLLGRAPRNQSHRMHLGSVLVRIYVEASLFK
jgi:hypothetical protein